MTTSLNRFDLNLLRVFDAVMEERSVLRASQRLCLSQSAVSHALARLREVVGDDLLIRTPNGMQPTARALTMAPLVRQAWQCLETAVGAPKFDPARSARRFTVAMNDFVSMVMVPRLLSLLRHEAPLVDLAIRSDSSANLTEQIDLGQIDAAIGSFSHVAARFRSRPLFACDDALIANSSRQLGSLSLGALSDLSIAAVSLHGERDELVEGFVLEPGLSRRSEMFDRAALEKALSVSGQSPRILVSLPHFLPLQALLEQSDLTAIVPRPLAESMARTQPLSIHELPYDTNSVDVSVLWHERTTNDAPQCWLLGILVRATEHLRDDLSKTKLCSVPTASHPPIPDRALIDVESRWQVAAECRP
jgi:DNA-binding transcriptional LysR family regulator